MDDQEKIYALMMDALDGEISENDSAELQQYLAYNADMAREWRAMQAIDTLFRQAPLMAAPAGFAERAMARIPKPAERLRFMSIFYLILLFAGLVPMLAGAVIFGNTGNILQSMPYLRDLIVSGTQVFQMLDTVLTALFAFSSTTISANPSVLGWVALLGGFVLVWRNMYQFLLTPPNLSGRQVA